MKIVLTMLFILLNNLLKRQCASKEIPLRMFKNSFLWNCAICDNLKMMLFPAAFPRIKCFSRFVCYKLYKQKFKCIHLNQMFLKIHCISRNFSENLILAVLARFFSSLKLCYANNNTRLMIICL